MIFIRAALLVLLLSLLGCVEDTQSPDPVLQDFPIAYTKHALYDTEGEPIPFDGRELLTFRVGGDLYLRERASTTAQEINITHQITQGNGDVRDLDVSHDGSKIIFSLREAELDGVPDNEQPTWNIWQYDLANEQLSRVIGSDIVAEQGQDLAPAYLPDGRIVFTSTRQRESGRVLLDEGKPQFTGLEESRDEHAALLHVMNSDGSEIQQISFNASHDYDPTVLSDGRILFSRWDNVGGRNAIRFYTIRPDGTELQLHYGAHSDQVGDATTPTDMIQPRQLDDGRLLASQVIRGENNRGGNLMIIDSENYIDHDKPTEVNRTSLSGPGQWHATDLDIQLEEDELSLGGRLLSAFPLWDGTQRMLISWSPCRIVTDGEVRPCIDRYLDAPTLVEADPLFGIYIYDLDLHTQRPVVLGEEGMVISEAVSLREREQSPVVLYDGIAGDGRIDPDLFKQQLGVIHIRSVYDIDGEDVLNPDISTIADPMQVAAADRSARFVKIVKSVAIPDRDTLELNNSAFGRSTRQLMREILGYGMVEPDGSVMVEVPANVPFTISILDGNGRRIHPRHQIWLQLRPGETLHCNGCHNHNSGEPHGRSDGPASVNPGALTSGEPFPNTHPDMVAEIGETMAQTRTRTSCTTDSDCPSRELLMDIEFNDVWTDPGLRTPDSAFSYRYADLDSSLPLPVTTACTQQWLASCRSVINYPEHIHPLWDLPRMDDDLNDVRCTTCHTDQDELGTLQVPVAQLQLDGGDSPEQADHLISYRELLFPDSVQELRDGALQDVLVQDTDGDGNLLFETDDLGELILDGEGNPIPIMVTINAPAPVMSVSGAISSRFFSLFESDTDRDFNHIGLLSDAEKRLISEWLDLGAQYYNDPFAFPQE